jgi:hypothetical protein
MTYFLGPFEVWLFWRCRDCFLWKMRGSVAARLIRRLYALPQLFLWGFRRNESRYGRDLRPAERRCAFFRAIRGTRLTGRR